MFGKSFLQSARPTLRYIVRIRLPQPATIEGREAFAEEGLHMK